MKIQFFPGNVKATAKNFMSYLDEEYFTDNSLKLSPGFIDNFRLAALNGFSVTQSVEGCGNIMYYFSLSDTKTLVLTYDLVQEFSGVVGLEIKNAVLAVPGVISPEVAKKYLNKFFLLLRF